MGRPGARLMAFKLVVLWTDAALWALFVALAGYAWRVVRQKMGRESRPNVAGGEMGRIPA